jgi:hypothetical protein
MSGLLSVAGVILPPARFKGVDGLSSDFGDLFTPKHCPALGILLLPAPIPHALPGCPTGNDDIPRVNRISSA